jgi:hypothetical protein
VCSYRSVHFFGSSLPLAIDGVRFGIGANLLKMGYHGFPRSVRITCAYCLQNLRMMPLATLRPAFNAEDVTSHRKEKIDDGI